MMPELRERIIAEQQFHDLQAAERSMSFRSGRADLRFTDAAYLDHETWIRPAFAQFGSLQGQSALDFGCGHGMAAVVMARQGARVTAFDLSPGYVEEARARAEANQVRGNFLVADGEALPFADALFDCIWGHAILHHLDMDRAGAELRRVLKPGGIAVFCEPWGGNPLLRFARQRLPYPGKHRTADEEPLLPRHLQQLWTHFPTLSIKPYQLFGMMGRLGGGRMISALHRLDDLLLPRIPLLEKWCRYLVLTLRR
ncbi:MAG: class I SAM-dependent methyltransferase [Bacteroidales bacterium]|nr:class I SAM-dependent methyltransferase [Bacteroidales bacterium]